MTMPMMPTDMKRLDLPTKATGRFMFFPLSKFYSIERSINDSFV